MDALDQERAVQPVEREDTHMEARMREEVPKNGYYHVQAVLIANTARDGPSSLFGKGRPWKEPLGNLLQRLYNLKKIKQASTVDCLDAIILFLPLLAPGAS